MVEAGGIVGPVDGADAQHVLQGIGEDLGSVSLLSRVDRLMFEIIFCEI